MRLNEFAPKVNNSPESNLITALELIRHRYKDKETSPKISTQSVINLVLNTDETFDYDALVDANENNPALKNIIKNFNKDYIELQPIGEPAEPDRDNTPPDENVVPNMAKAAAKADGAAGF